MKTIVAGGQKVTSSVKKSKIESLPKEILKDVKDAKSAPVAEVSKSSEESESTALTSNGDYWESYLHAVSDELSTSYRNIFGY